jgi:hypothetical protein
MYKNQPEIKQDYLSEWLRFVAVDVAGLYKKSD